jgi:hypothetical protein
MARKHYVTGRLGPRLKPDELYKVYQETLRTGDLDIFMEAIAPFAVQAASSLGGLDSDIYNDVVSSNLEILWRFVLNAVEKRTEFTSGLHLVSYINKRVYSSLKDVRLAACSEVVFAESIEDVLVSRRVAVEERADKADVDAWVRFYIVSHLRFNGWKKDCCLLLLDEGPGALDGIVEPEIAKFFNSYVAWLIQVAIDEYAKI